MTVKIAPSILSSDFACLGEEVKKISAAGADYVHFDVMDGHFVPNITIGSVVLKAVRKYSKLPFDTHLMIANPEKYIEKFAEAGADIITIHAEAVVHLDRIIDQIHACGKKAGVSIVPSTHESTLDYIYDKIDLILLMTVNPGFGGQKFLASQLVKIKAISKKIKASGRKIDLEVDGGMNPVTAKECVANGANVIVAGNYIFHNQNYKANIAKLR